jgi:hypothetical protein
MGVFMANCFRLLVALLLCSGAACRQHDEPLASIPFMDRFDRMELGDNWVVSKGSDWRIKDGVVVSSGTDNRALWLKAKLPDDAVIELDLRTDSQVGDMKFELYADGENHASGYILIFGGWNNTISCIARLNEHGADRQEVNQSGQVQPGKTYHMKVVRKGRVLRWSIDGKMFLDYYDSDPLRGKGHDRLAFNNWRSKLSFSNLSIRAAGADEP